MVYFVFTTTNIKEVGRELQKSYQEETIERVIIGGVFTLLSELFFRYSSKIYCLIYIQMD